MILATKSGWLIGCNFIRETPKATIVKPWGSKKERRVEKESKTEKLFDGVPEAQEWILGVNRD